MVIRKFKDFIVYRSREISSMCNLVLTNLLGEQILRTLIFKRFEVLEKCVVLKANLISLKMNDINVILGVDKFQN